MTDRELLDSIETGLTGHLDDCDKCGEEDRACVEAWKTELLGRITDLERDLLAADATIHDQRLEAGTVERLTRELDGARVRTAGLELALDAANDAIIAILLRYREHAKVGEPLAAEWERDEARSRAAAPPAPAKACAGCAFWHGASGAAIGECRNPKFPGPTMAVDVCEHRVHVGIDLARGPDRSVQAVVATGTFAEVAAELARARAKHGPINTAHEGYAVILEELDELWEIVRLKRELRDPQKMRAEAVQVAAMAIRFAEDLCGERSGDLEENRDRANARR